MLRCRAPCGAAAQVSSCSRACTGETLILGQRTFSRRHKLILKVQSQRTALCILCSLHLHPHADAQIHHVNLEMTRESHAAQVSASGLSFTVKGVTLSAADLPASTLVDLQPHIAREMTGFQHAVSSSSGTASAAQAASQQVVAASPPVQRTAAGRAADAFQHAVQLAIAAGRMTAEAADTARRQLLQSSAARRGSLVTAVAVALGAVLLLLVATKLWRRMRKVRWWGSLVINCIVVSANASSDRLQFANL